LVGRFFDHLTLQKIEPHPRLIWRRVRINSTNQIAENNL